MNLEQRKDTVRYCGLLISRGACSSAWLERIPDKDEAGGSSPPRPTSFSGGLAQLVERLLCKQEVSGSTPLSSTKLMNSKKRWCSLAEDKLQQLFNNF